MSRTADPILAGWATIAVFLAMLCVSAVATALDERVRNGVSV